MSSTEYWNPQTFRNDVDSWIDELDVDRNSNPLNVMTGSKDGTINQSILMASLMQQHLPQVEIPHFKGEAIQWVEFVVKFRDVVHDQPYLSDRQRNQLLMQHLRGEAKRAVQEYVNDPRGYPLSLKKLKYLFGQEKLLSGHRGSRWQQFPRSSLKNMIAVPFGSSIASYDSIENNKR